jgi:ABC-2 type transport system ATP-binding protein
MIETIDLTRTYGTLTALAGVDVGVPPGTIYALLGPNGAGKTTLINILTTLLQPTSGTARVAGYDIVKQADLVRQQIGVTFQDIILDPDLTGREVLDVHGRLYRQPAETRRRRIAELVSLVQLDDALDRRVKTYSGGMKRRLELARGLMTEPKVLFLDEPTQGLDPQNRAAVWDYVRALSRDHGLTLLVTTHFMDEADALADTVGILDHGQMVTEGTPQALVTALGADVVRVVGKGDPHTLLSKLQQLAYVDQVNISPDQSVIQIGVDQGNRRLAEIVGHATSNGFQIEEIAVARPTLADVFLKHTGRALRD